MKHTLEIDIHNVNVSTSEMLKQMIVKIPLAKLRLIHMQIFKLIFYPFYINN